MKQGLELTESVFSGTAKDAAATMADLKELKPKEALQITWESCSTGHPL